VQRGGLEKVTLVPKRGPQRHLPLVQIDLIPWPARDLFADCAEWRAGQAGFRGLALPAQKTL
jgi:hypothetical protein